MYLNILLGMVGPSQIILIIVAVLLLFGGRKIPELMKGLGQGIKEFKKATKDEPSGIANPARELEAKSENS